MSASTRRATSFPASATPATASSARAWTEVARDMSRPASRYRALDTPSEARDLLLLVLLPFAGVGRLQAIGSRLRPGGRPSVGVASRLGQPSMADSPPQRIHAASHNPQPGTTIAQSLTWLRKSSHRSITARVKVSRALAIGDRGKQNMDVLRVSQGRMP